ncbi:permease family protein [Asticcacaulis biprosthecium C19]|uniref:Permease family protein n=1 Tax=Asticcacaulis biprosthecium C19 TaxID=715226 RepID=F4QPK2_9CAUL|nr:NCS2 family permease [Asticcacaulis biprosthecium]EGF91260.1 permease family protein [Asticcacaulis biprosthecium C19]
MTFLDKYFNLTAQGTSVRTEVVAGFTTFLTMAYIILVNPAILSQTGMPIAAIAAATCLSAAFASILMGLVANYPLALAPGMGLNAYFTFTVVKGMGLPWQVALGCVFISGVCFLILTFAGVRQLIVNAIPKPLFAAVAAGIGLFIAFIGLKEAGIIVANPATTVALGDLHAPTPLLALAGLLIIAVLNAWRVKGAILIGVVTTAAIGWALQLVTYTPQPYNLMAMTATVGQLDIAGALDIGKTGFGVLEIIFVFLFVDLFDNVGTLVGVSKRAGLIDVDGKIPRLNRILTVDSIATMVGSFFGTSTVTSYIESAAGVQAGGRTGLTAVVTGLLFLVALFFAPYAQFIPAAATAPALIIVGAMMMKPLAEIEWDDPIDALPAFLILIGIPLTFSIANGLAFGITAYALLKLLRGKAGWSDWMLLVLAGLFVVRFVYLSAG